MSIRLGGWLAILAAAVLLPSSGRAADIPEWLPQYDLGIHLDVAQRRVTVQQRITWTNRHARPAEELVLNVYPRYKIPDGDVVLYAKTLELLRAPPSEGIDSVGHRLQVHRVTLATRELAFRWREDMHTALVIPLPRAVRQGEKVTVDLDFTLDLPEKQGRWGHWKGVTFLANWTPTLAYYDDAGWQPTPFVAWHQPFFNEAGVYSVRLTLPADQKIASTGSVHAEEDAGNGFKNVQIVGCCARDFALVCSNRFQEFTAQAETAKVRVLAFPEHEYLARKALEYACEVIPIYNQWFGTYPYDEFDIVESHFPWNGNELSGLIMIDSRVLAMPTMAELYVDHLVSHETLHQWWYNVVGTNGYAETFMDEAVASFYTARRIQAKYGKNAPLVRFPHGLHWLPNIHHEDYRFYGLYGTLARHEATATVQPLDGFGNIVTLFSMTYDRGAKILNMIEDRLGEDAFQDFMRLVYGKYQFRILRVADFQRELEAYTGRSWEQFFKDWIYGCGMTDWAIEKVETRWRFHWTEPLTYPVTVTVRQKGEFNEPVILGVKFEKDGPYELRIPIHPYAGAVEIDEPEISVEDQPDGSIRIKIALPRPPVQISIDPDQALLDREPANNHWKPEINWRFTPLYTPLEETDLTTPYDRWSIILGPWFDQKGHLGFRTGAYRLQQFHGGVYAAYDVDDEDVVLGADALIDHWPWHNTQVGFDLDHSITPDWAETRRDRGKLFGRYVLHYTPSLYLEPMEFVELYGRLENEFWRDHFVGKPGIERYDDLTAFGVRYHRDYYTPYWDAEAGYRVNVTYEYGPRILGADETFQRVEGEFGVVKGLPDGLGFLSETRLALRVYGAVGVPDNGEHFELGGQRRLRGLERANRLGSALWIGTLEWRLPLWRDADCDVCDHMFRLRHVYGAVFYDVGDIYLNGHTIKGVAHSVGAGLRLDLAMFSFMERMVFRLDVAKVVNDDEPIQLWFGLQHPF